MDRLMNPPRCNSAPAVRSVTVVTAQADAVIYAIVYRKAFSNPRGKRVHSRANESLNLNRMPRRRASGLGAKRGPRVDLPLRGARSAAPMLFPRAGAPRSQITAGA
jgi:hypothetical protein